ncbi:MAG: alpha/beta hydrolase [Dehalococcoidia bacterium]|jgi:alpha-beta hydrolase superfamily lysophospholipase|nr:alpha/beta hydrolase [Dehalococcoidia bacterium]
MLWMILALVALATFGLLFVAVYFADAFTGGRRTRVQGTPADLGMRYEEVQFLTADRLTLRGWFLESPGARATVVLVHESGATRADRDRGLLHLQRDYVRRGFSVFAFDLRAHGESGGKRDTLGCQERLDVQAAVAYVRRRSGRTPILLHGFGYGASLAIDAVARGVDVAGIVADSPFATMRSFLRARHRHIPAPVFQASIWMARRLMKCDPNALNPIQSIEKVQVPVLFVHSQVDDVVPASHTLNLSAASLDPRMRVWIVDDHIGHGTAYLDQPDAYLRRCLQFVDEVVPARTLFAVPSATVSEAV